MAPAGGVESVSVQLDPGNPDLTLTVEVPASGATIRWLKEELCRQDPTGATTPEQLKLCALSRPTVLLDDGAAITPELSALTMAGPEAEAAGGQQGGAGEAVEPLLAAIREGNSQEVALLVVGDTGAESARLQDGRTPLHVAVELLGGTSGVPPARVCEIAGLLLACDADPNVEAPPLNETPLQIALRQSQTLEQADVASGLEVIRALLDAKADPNRGDEFGETPLFEAAISGSLEACEVLLFYGASPTARNVNGNCAADLATADEVKQLLEQAAKCQEEEPQVQELEFRQAPDGAYYTKEQFQEHYGGLSEWSEAPKSAAPGGMAPGGLDLDELKEGEEKFGDLRRQVANSPSEDRGRPQSTPSAADRRPAPAARAPSSASSAQSLREQGNEHFKAGRYQEARRLYTEALGPQPSDAGILSNRAAAALMLKDWEAAFDDAFRAMKLDMNNVKACERAARSLLLQNRLEDGLRFCQQRVRGGPGVQGLSREQQAGEWALFMKVAQRIPHHAGLLHQMEQVLANPSQAASEGPAGSIVAGVQEMQALLSETELVSPFGERLGFTKVRALLFPVPGISGQSEETRRQWTQTALSELDRLLKEKYEWPDTHHWRARCLVRLGRRKEAREALKEAMRLAKRIDWMKQHLITEQLLDSLTVTETQKEKGNKAFQRQDWTGAVAAYDAAVKADEGRWDVEFSAQLHCNRSNARSKLGLIDMALEDANAAVALNPTYTKALFRRGLLYMEQQRHRDALKDFEEVARLAPNFPGLAEWLPRARNWTKAPPKKNFYSVLGISFEASPTEIKKAYKTAALKWHPDKNRDNPEKAEKMFKEILEAFEVLSDPKRRAEYDWGQQEEEQGGGDFGGDFFHHGGFNVHGFGMGGGFWPGGMGGGGGFPGFGGQRFQAGQGRPFGQHFYGNRSRPGYQPGWQGGAAWPPRGGPRRR